MLRSLPLRELIRGSRLKVSKKTFQAFWRELGPEWLPFADAASAGLPLGRLLRLSLFQVTVGMAIVLLNGTLNRVMIVELLVPAWLVGLMISLPMLFAPFRALIGHSSDNYRSFLGWRRVPFIWMGTLLQFGGLAIMPFALLILSGDTHGPLWIGQAGAALAFLLVGAGLHTAQTSGLALATDLAEPSARPRVVALLYVMLLLGMLVSAVAFGLLLENFSQLRLIQVIQGAALLTMLLNLAALWKQEPQDFSRTAPERVRPKFAEAWRAYRQSGRAGRLLIAVALGTAGFGMQDILLEPYGAQILALSVSDTTTLTAILSAGTLVALYLASRRLTAGLDPCRLSAYGALIGILAFVLVSFSAGLQSATLFRVATGLIGFGAGFFAVGTLTSAMDFAQRGGAGLALGAWGAVQATAAGLGIAAGAALRDLATRLLDTGPLAGYLVVYHLEIVLLFATLAVIGPLVQPGRAVNDQDDRSRFGLSEMPGS